MPKETKAHKEAMQRYRERRRRQQEQGTGRQGVQVEAEAEPQWRTRRHRTRKPNGELTTDHLFELRNKLIIASETKALSSEELQEELEIEQALRNRHELAPLAEASKSDWTSFYSELYARLGLEQYLPGTIGELTRGSCEETTLAGAAIVHGNLASKLL